MERSAVGRALLLERLLGFLMFTFRLLSSDCSSLSPVLGAMPPVCLLMITSCLPDLVFFFLLYLRSKGEGDVNTSAQFGYPELKVSQCTFTSIFCLTQSIATAYPKLYRHGQSFFPKSVMLT